jgi:hypothetical protein
VPPNYEDACVAGSKPHQGRQTTEEEQAEFSRELGSKLVVWDADENADEESHEENVEQHEDDDE